MGGKNLQYALAEKPSQGVKSVTAKEEGRMALQVPESLNEKVLKCGR
jgi:hypothetical protein